MTQRSCKSLEVLYRLERIGKRGIQGNAFRAGALEPLPISIRAGVKYNRGLCIWF